MTVKDTRLDRILMHPHWCMGDPLAWEIHNTVEADGIAFAARLGDVGLFNLLWLMMDRTTPPAAASAYKTPQIRWVFSNTLVAERRPVFNGCTIKYHAAMKTLPEFASFILAHPALKVTPFGFEDEYACRFRQLLARAVR